MAENVTEEQKRILQGQGDFPPVAPPLRFRDSQVRVDYATRDSGERVEFDSGMVRDTEAGKARFDLLVPDGVPYEEQMLTRFANLMARGAEKYDARNWEKARGEAELLRYRSSAFRHLVQWMTGGQAENDPEDHAAAVMFNLMAGEMVRYKMGQDDAPKTIGEAVKAGYTTPGVDFPVIAQGSEPYPEAMDTYERSRDMAAALATLTCRNRGGYGQCLGHSHSSSPTGVIYHDDAAGRTSLE